MHNQATFLGSSFSLVVTGVLDSVIFGGSGVESFRAGVNADSDSVNPDGFPSFPNGHLRMGNIMEFASITNLSPFSNKKL